MADQAGKLRQAWRYRRMKQAVLPPVRRLAVTSGKGGVGKSNISLNLALALCRLGRRTLLVDADTNLANIDILLGIHPRRTLADVILRDCFIEDILVEGPEGLRILPAGSGVAELVGLDDVAAERLQGALADLERGQDLILLDTGAGISQPVVELSCGSDEVLVVTTPEPTAITDAYAAIKVITAHNPAVKLYLLVNQAKDAREAEEVSRKITLVVENYLNLSLETLGFIPFDIHVQHAVVRQTPFILAYPRCPAARHLTMIARRCLKIANPCRRESSATAPGGSLFRQLFGAPKRIRQLYSNEVT